MRVEVVVDEIVLHGIDPRDRHRIGDAIERQLRDRLSHESVAERIARDARNREPTVTRVVLASVQAAVTSPTVRRG